MRTRSSSRNLDIQLHTSRETEICDLTKDVEQRVAASGIKNGLCLVFTTSSTSAITTLEFEPGLVHKDLPEALSRLFPRHGEGVEYGHQEMWHDGNGHSHVRASFLGPSLTIPVRDGKPVLGQWQQVVFIELDNKPRDRRVVVQVVGD